MFKSYPDVVNIADVCTMLRISKKKAYELIHNNQLPYRKIGRIYRIPKSSVITYITSIESSEERK